MRSAHTANTSGSRVNGEGSASWIAPFRLKAFSAGAAVEVSPTGGVGVSASLDPNKLPRPCPGGLGLTTALVALESGWVVIGSLPTKNGGSATVQAGCLLMLDSTGNPVGTNTLDLLH